MSESRQPTYTEQLRGIDENMEVEHRRIQAGGALGPYAELKRRRAALVEEMERKLAKIGWDQAIKKTQDARDAFEAQAATRRAKEAVDLNYRRVALGEGAAIDKRASGQIHDILGSNYRKIAEHLCAKHGIVLRQTVAGGSLHGYALTVSKLVEVPRIVDGLSGATALHEVFHAIHGCDHTRTRTADGERTVCIKCEFRAWQSTWRIIVENRLPWDKPMHADMISALRSYESYMDENQRAELMMLDTTQARCRIVTGLR